ncbi:MAG TPA: alpha amylase C-terminal domain-containing protein [Deferrisomatales bacterium]|nr:alpha amylase C-terminal domain-containing protein [Deferrisomatales bacterium]
MGPADTPTPWGDPYLAPYREHLLRRCRRVEEAERRLTGGDQPLEAFASGHTYFGLHRTRDGWRFAEWAPNAEDLWLVGDATGWETRDAYALTRLDDHGRWELRMPADALGHGQHYKLRVAWPGGGGERIPAWARRVVQDPATLLFGAQVWAPPQPYRWKHPEFRRPATPPLVYEAHVGMAQEREGVGTYDEFRRLTLPRIRAAGYDTVQLMGVAEHPYYASFGYHVSSFFAASSRFGTPEELKALVDDAHGMGLSVVLDLVHSHAVANEAEGLSRFDGTRHQFFHSGPRGEHPAWGSLCFDYGKPEVLHFLLSNCRFWLDEYRVDGFRLDGITSMLYRDHGLGRPFTDYAVYFDDGVDEDALTYLALANRVIHAVRPDALTVAEDVSGMPGLCAPVADGGCGFDCRLAMGVPDCWFKLADGIPDEAWNLGWLWHELTSRRGEERTLAYVESHDQALVGGKSMLFTLVGAAMYEHMGIDDPHPAVQRGVALLKLMRLATLGASGGGYLNFMGNEFGHPEWVDFPREGNGWSYHYARRQWSLRDRPDLRFSQLATFDAALLAELGTASVLNAPARPLPVPGGDQVLAFGRGGHVLALNWHPTRSYAGYRVEAPPGAYTLTLDTDRPEFGGQGRVAADQRFFTTPLREGGVLRHCLQLYLPCRTGLVLRRENYPARGEEFFR